MDNNQTPTPNVPQPIKPANSQPAGSPSPNLNPSPAPNLNPQTPPEPQPVQSPPPSPPSATPQTPPAPSAQDAPPAPKEEPPKNIGVGTPNIGIEDDHEISKSASAPTGDFELSDPPKDGSATPDLVQAPSEKPATSPDSTINVEFQSKPISQTPEPTVASTPQNPPQAPVRAQTEQGSDSSDDDERAIFGSVSPKPTPPVKAPSKMSGSLTAILILALAIGSAAGFYGYKYYDGSKVSASVEESPTATQTPSKDTSVWQIYTSTKHDFSLKYPNAWLASTSDPDANSISFASNKANLDSISDGFKVDIAFQDANGLELKDWVEANSVATAEKSKAKEITVSEETAYQQELSKNGPQVATYIAREDQVMIVTYSASAENLSSGGDFYNGIINSIKLN